MINLPDRGSIVLAGAPTSFGRPSRARAPAAAGVANRDELEAELHAYLRYLSCIEAYHGHQHTKYSRFLAPRPRFLLVLAFERIKNLEITRFPSLQREALGSVLNLCGPEYPAFRG